MWGLQSTPVRPGALQCHLIHPRNKSVIRVIGPFKRGGDRGIEGEVTRLK